MYQGKNHSTGSKSRRQVQQGLTLVIVVGQRLEQLIPLGDYVAALRTYRFARDLWYCTYQASFDPLRCSLTKISMAFMENVCRYEPEMSRRYSVAPHKLGAVNILACRSTGERYFLCNHDHIP